jgi:hypothetical protein
MGKTACECVDWPESSVEGCGVVFPVGVKASHSGIDYLPSFVVRELRSSCQQIIEGTQKRNFLSTRQRSYAINTPDLSR